MSRSRPIWWKAKDGNICMPADMTGYDKSDKFLLNGNQLEEMIWNWRNGRENGTWKVREVDDYVGGRQAAITMMQTWTMQKERWIALNRNQRKEVTEKNFRPALWDRYFEFVEKGGDRTIDQQFKEFYKMSSHHDQKRRANTASRRRIR